MDIITSSLPDNFERKLKNADMQLSIAERTNNPFWFGEFIDDLGNLSQGIDHKGLCSSYPGWEPAHFRHLVEMALQKKESSDMLALREQEMQAESTLAA